MKHNHKHDQNRASVEVTAPVRAHIQYFFRDHQDNLGGIEHQSEKLQRAVDEMNAGHPYTFMCEVDASILDAVEQASQELTEAARKAAIAQAHELYAKGALPPQMQSVTAQDIIEDFNAWHLIRGN